MLRGLQAGRRAATLLLALCCAAAPAAAAEPDDLTALRAQALDLVNQSRRAQGLAPLRADEALRRAAQAHSADMLRQDYFAHESPDGGTVRDRVLAAGGSGSALVAENIARCEGCEPDAGRIRRFQEGWMQSPGHRENILRPGMERFGFGLAWDPASRQLLATQTFAGPGTAPPGGQGGGGAPLGGREAAEAALRTVNAARAQAGVPGLARSETLGRAAERLLSQGDALDLEAALPAGAARDWRSVAVLSAACSGCGARPTEGDIGRFLDQWRRQAEYRKRLLAAGPTHLGFAITADGEGAKRAVAVLGTAR